MAEYPATTEATSLPHSRESEEATVGAVLINPETYYDCASFLVAGDFYIHRHKWIWESFDSLIEQKQPIDLLTVADELERTGRLAEIGGPAYLTTLVNQVPSSLNTESYGRIVKDRAIRRKMIAAANNIATLAYSEHIPLEKALDDTWTAVENAVETSMFKNSAKHVSDVLSDKYDSVDELAKTPDDKKPFLRTGLIDLDRYLRMRPKQMISIVARPGVGKSALAQTIIRNVYKTQRKNVVLFTLEMGDDEVAERLIAQEAEINITHIADAKLEDREWPLFTNAIETLSDGNFWINDDADITVPQMRAECKKIQARYGLDLVVVDYGGLIEAPGNTPNERVSYVSRNLKKIAKSLGVTVLALWQMNRAVEARADGEPILSDIRDSGSIEQDSDTVAFIYYKDEPNPRSKVNHVKCKIAKQRNGPTATFDLARITVTTGFDNAVAMYT